MKPFLVYWFWPNPGGWSYVSPKIEAALIALAVMLCLSFVISAWRRRLANPVTRNLSGSWSAASFWFGLVGIALVVSRVEAIQFLAMRILWGVWVLSLALYLIYQILQFKRRHYVLLKRVEVTDERDKYLPRKK